MNLGVAFQLKDDFLDVYGDAAVFGKNIGGDILCDKKTYMLIKAFEHADAGQLDCLNAWVGAVSFNPEEKIAAVTELYDRIGVKELCEKKMEEYSERAMESLLAVKVADVDMNGLRNLGDQLKEKLGQGVVVIASAQDGKVNLMASATEEAQKRGAHAGNLIKAIAGLVGGGGGGRPGMAQAGGKNPAGIQEALEKAIQVVKDQIE